MHDVPVEISADKAQDVETNGGMNMSRPIYEIALILLKLAAWLNLAGGIAGAFMMPAHGDGAFLLSIASILAGVLGWAFLIVLTSLADDAEAIRFELRARSPGPQRRGDPDD